MEWSLPPVVHPEIPSLLILGVLLTRADALDHLDAAALADVDGRQRQGPVERVAARRVRVAVALEASHPTAS